MSTLSPWLQSHGFVKDPFGFRTADMIDPEVVQETYLYEKKLEKPMLSKHSVALLAPYGGGKTMSRLYWQARLQKEYNNPIIAIYNDFSAATKDLVNVSLDSHEASIIDAINESVWKVFKYKNEKLLTLTEQDQKWWWALFENYHSDPEFQVTNYPLLQESYESLYAHDKKEPFGKRESLDRKLARLVAYLNRADFSHLLILIDEVDAQTQHSPSEIEKIVFPLLNNLRLYSHKQITWKFFLPSTLNRMIDQSSAVRKLRVQVEEIRWDEQQLKELLQNQLSWASHSAVSSLDQLSEEIYELDDAFIELVQQNQSRHGAPRTVLKYGSELFNKMDSRGDTFITKEGWQAFVDLIQEHISNQKLIMTTAGEQLEPITSAQLRQVLVDYFDLFELRILCSDLNIKFEEIPGDTLSRKSLALVEYFERQGRIDDLKKQISQMRPNLTL